MAKRFSGVPSVAKSNIKVVVKEGAKRGRTTTVLVGVHGNETSGIRALDKLLPAINVVRGKVFFIVANLSAIKKKKRFVEANLNRCFFPRQPAKLKNTIEGKTAREIMFYLDQSDALLDVHGSNSAKTVPFVICSKKKIQQARRLPFNIISYNWDKFEPGSSDYYMNLSGKTALCVECGYNKDPRSVRRAERAILSFLRMNKNILGKIPPLKRASVYKIIGIHFNRLPFTKARDFADFEYLSVKTQIGKEGNRLVFLSKDKSVLFVRNQLDKKQECFLVAKQTG